MAVESTTEACVSRRDLVDAAVRRGAKIDPDAPVRIRVHAVPTSSGVAIEVSGDNELGRIEDRHLVASSCEEALDAVALLIALAGDEERSGQAASAVTSTAPEAPTTTNVRPHAEATEPRPTGASRRLYTTIAWTGSTLAEGQLGARLALGMRLERGPWAELGIGGTLPRTLTGGGGDASFTWVTGRAALAPLAITPFARSSLSAYAMFEAGVVVASGTGVSRVQSHAQRWYAVGAGARFQWSFTPRAFLNLEAGATMPLFRDEFVFVNGGRTYLVPAVGAETALMLGWSFS